MSLVVGKGGVVEVGQRRCFDEARDAQKFRRGVQESLRPELGRQIAQVRLVPFDALEREAVADCGCGDAGAVEVFRELFDQRSERRFVLHIWFCLHGAETWV
jgi:hypothetical protein